MKNAMKIMIVLGMTVVFCGTLTGCKRRNEEEKIKELVEEMGDARTEQEAAKIANKIEKLERKAKKNAKEINIEIRQRFTFWNEDETLSDGMTRFSMVFKNVVITKETILGERKAGKKYIMILAETKNLGPHKSFRAPSGRNIQVKTNKGFYRFQNYPVAFPSAFFSSEPPFPLDWKILEKWQFPSGVLGKSVRVFKERLEPEETGWTIYWASIPEDSAPLEVFAQWSIDPGQFGDSRRTNFRLELTQFGEYTNEGRKRIISSSYQEISKKNTISAGRITMSNIAGDYTIVAKRPNGREIKNPSLITLKKDGTGLINSSGEWEVRGDQLEFRDGQKLIGYGGQIIADTLRRELPRVSLRKQRKAEVIKRIKTGSILWSKYYFTGDRSNIIKSISLEIKKHGNFRELRVLGNVWRIKDGGVEITVIDKSQKEKKIEGKIEENTIIFQDGGSKFKYVRQD